MLLNWLELVVGVIGAVFVFVRMLLSVLLAEASGRSKMVHFLRGGFASRYRAGVESLLRTVSSWVDGVGDLEKARAWTPQLLITLLGIAVFYPIAFVLIQWVWLGESITIGSVLLAPLAESVWARFAIGALFIVAMYLIVRGFFSDGVAGSFLLLSGMLASLGCVALMHSVAFPPIMSIAIVAALGVLLGAIVSRRIWRVALFSVVTTCSAAYLVELNDREFLYVVGGSILVALIYWSQSAAPLLRVGFILATMVAVALAMKTKALQVEYGSSTVMPFFIFFVAFPLMNGLSDFLSAGFTRWSIMRGIQGSGAHVTIGFALADIAVALVCFSLMAALGLMFLIWSDGITDVGRLDTSQLITSVRATPERYVWLFAAIFTTVAPTLLHLTIASASILTVALKVTSGRLAQSLSEIPEGPRGDADLHAHVHVLSFVIVGAVTVAALLCFGVMLGCIYGLPPFARILLQLLEELSNGTIG